MKQLKVSTSIALALIAVVAMLFVMGSADPGASTVVGVTVITPFSARVVTGSVITYSASTQVSAYGNGIMFVTADVTADPCTVTVQFSADNVNWVNGFHYVVISDTETATTDVLYLAADGTSYLKFPIDGAYMRLSLAHNDAMTVTAKVRLVNNGGR